MEAEHSGFAYAFVKSLLTRAEIHNSIDMTECLLRLEGGNNSEGKIIDRVNLNSKIRGGPYIYIYVHRFSKFGGS